MSEAAVVKPENTENRPAVELSKDELENKIIKQVEYYFGDVNLLKDTFMQEEISKDDGWVSLDVLLKFNRLKQLSTESEAIIKALQRSTSGLLEVNAEKPAIRRSQDRPLPKSTDGSRGVAILNPQTVYVKGFSNDDNLDTVLGYFESVGFPAEGVYLRRNMKTSEFKGSVFATMSSREVAQKFVAEAAKEYNGKEMVMLMKEDYHIKKAQERVERRKKQKDRINEVTAERKKKAIEENLQKMNNDITKAAILKISNLAEGTVERDLRTFWNKFARVAWVDLTEDKSGAFVRFEEEGTAQKAWDAARTANPAEGDDSSIVMEKSTVKFDRILEGEEEETFWKGIWTIRAERRANMQQARGRGGGRSNRGQRGGYKGKRSAEFSNDNAKRMKKEIESMPDSDTSDDGDN